MQSLRIFCSIVLLVACGDDDGTSLDGSTDMDAGLDTGVDAAFDSASDAPMIDAAIDADTPTGWVLRSHPCAGNRTDTLWMDDDGTFFVGCGSTTSGDQGFYVSTNDGETWDAPDTTPNGFFDTWRVHTISRSADGLLYVGGRNTANDQRVVSVDTSTSPWGVELVLEAQGRVGFSFEVGGFRRAADGRAVAESATGNDILYRESDDGEWLDGRSWYEAYGAQQLLEITEHGGEFFGCGSTISEPPRVFLPGDGAGLQFELVELASGIGAFDGEMWGLGVDDAGIVVAGVNQNADVGMVYAVAHDGTIEHTFDVSTLYPDAPTWMRGACRDGSTLVAVGEQSTRGRAVVVLSDNGGESWSDISPEAPSLHRCVIRDGSLYAAGADGTFGIYPID